MSTDRIEDFDRIPEQAAAWRAAGCRVALATVLSTWGSAPRPAGSQLAIDETGRFLGSVSGGCIEGAIVTEARAVIEAGHARIVEFGISNEEAWMVGLTCGGRIRILLEPVA